MTATLARGAGTSGMALADLVRWRRTALNMTQSQLAERDPLGKFTQAEISQYESGKVGRSSRARMERLSTALGLPYDLVMASTYQGPMTDEEVVGFVARFYAQAPFPTNAPPHEQVLADLMALAVDRPDLMATMRQLRDSLDEEKYRQAVAIIWRHMMSGIETARDIFIPVPSAKDTSRTP